MSRSRLTSHSVAHDGRIVDNVPNQASLWCRLWLPGNLQGSKVITGPFKRNTSNWGASSAKGNMPTARVQFVTQNSKDAVYCYIQYMYNQQSVHAYT